MDQRYLRIEIPGKDESYTIVKLLKGKTISITNNLERMAIDMIDEFEQEFICWQQEQRDAGKKEVCMLK